MSAVRLRRLRLACWALAVALGALQAWASRHDMNPDGVSYLDLGDAFVRGDLAHAVSAYWPPLYAFILGAAVGLLRPSPVWEFPLVHAVNFVLYLGTLASLEFLLANAAPRAPGWPAWAWRAWGSALFLVAALHMVTLRFVTPDLLVLALTLLAAGWLGRWADGRVGRREALLFGAALGAGALAKAAAFPLAALGLGLALAAAPDRRRAAPRALLALAAFVVVTGPWIGAVSARAGRLTLGENASLNYLWFVNREFQQPLVSFEVSRPAAWRLVHPPRHVLDAPDVWEFAQPVGGTLPLWFDPVYWHAGAEMRLSVAGHAAALWRSAGAYGRLALRLLPLAVGLAVLMLLAGRHGWTRREGALAVFALAPLAGYALIHVERRYVAGAVVVLGLALLAGVRAAEPRALAAVTLTALPLAVLPVAIDVAYNAAHEARAELRGEALPNQAWRAAGALRAAGVAVGDGVAVAGDPFQAGWARLARVRIVAAVAPDGLAPCWADATCRARLVAALAGTGATALVAERPPPAAVAAGGLARLAGTDLFAHRLR